MNTIRPIKRMPLTLTGLIALALAFCAAAIGAGLFFF